MHIPFLDKMTITDGLKTYIERELRENLILVNNFLIQQGADFTLSNGDLDQIVFDFENERPETKFNIPARQRSAFLDSFPQIYQLGRVIGRIYHQLFNPSIFGIDNGDYDPFDERQKKLEWAVEHMFAVILYSIKDPGAPLDDIDSLKEAQDPILFYTLLDELSPHKSDRCPKQEHSRSTSYLSAESTSVNSKSKYTPPEITGTSAPSKSKPDIHTDETETLYQHHTESVDNYTPPAQTPNDVKLKDPISPPTPTLPEDYQIPSTLESKAGSPNPLLSGETHPPLTPIRKTHGYEVWEEDEPQTRAYDNYAAMEKRNRDNEQRNEEKKPKDPWEISWEDKQGHDAVIEELQTYDNNLGDLARAGDSPQLIESLKRRRDALYVAKAIFEGHGDGENYKKVIGNILKSDKRAALLALKIQLDF